MAVSHGVLRFVRRDFDGVSPARMAADDPFGAARGACCVAAQFPHGQ